MERFNNASAGKYIRGLRYNTMVFNQIISHVSQQALQSREDIRMADHLKAAQMPLKQPQ